MQEFSTKGKLKCRLRMCSLFVSYQMLQDLFKIVKPLIKIYISQGNSKDKKSNKESIQSHSPPSKQLQQPTRSVTPAEKDVEKRVTSSLNIRDVPPTSSKQTDSSASSLSFMAPLKSFKIPKRDATKTESVEKVEIKEEKMEIKAENREETPPPLPTSS